MQFFTEVKADHSHTCNTVLRGTFWEFKDLADYLRDEPFDEFMEIITIKLDNANDFKEELVYLTQEEIESLISYLETEMANDDKRARKLYHALFHIPF